jgi:hypothetical protein
MFYVCVSFFFPCCNRYLVILGSVGVLLLVRLPMPESETPSALSHPPTLHTPSLTPMKEEVVSSSCVTELSPTPMKEEDVDSSFVAIASPLSSSPPPSTGWAGVRHRLNTVMRFWQQPYAIYFCVWCSYRYKLLQHTS